MFEKILLPVDLAEPGMIHPAIDAALELASSARSELRLVNVQPKAAIGILGYIAADLEDQVRKAAEHDLEILAGRLPLPAERVSHAVRFGPIYHEALEEARAWGADLIVICSHRPDMASYLLGSNAQSIVRHAAVSVLVLRT